LSWNAINERLLYARFNSSYVRLSVLVCYAPTDEADDEDKAAFYESLQATLENIPKHDVHLVIGDFNARVGSNNKNLESIMGRHGMGNMMDNGHRLVEFVEDIIWLSGEPCLNTRGFTS
jgi:exonuclease III